MTGNQALKYLAEQLESIYDQDEARNIAHLVLEYITGKTRTEWISSRPITLNAAQVEQLNGFIPRLINHEPVQYVLNEAWFCGLKFYVDKNVLIPRPETEELVEWVIANCRFPVDELKILDIGTGSGCIPIALKRRIRKAEVWSCDSSEAALKTARYNSENLGAVINFLHMDFLDEKQRVTLPSFDIIVSNPPYVPAGNKSAMRPNVLQFEPASALFVPDGDPFIFYKAIARFGLTHLLNNGAIYTEIHEDLGQQVIDLYQKEKFSTELKKDMQGKERMVRAVLNV
jgi:release factor glutamine methyltransferase